MSLRRAASIAIVCACLAGTAIASAMLYEHEKNAADDASRDIAARVSTRVADIIANTSQGLIGVGALFDASVEVRPDEFAAYARHLVADPAVTSIVFLEAVDHDGRAAWEARNGVEITAIGVDGPSPRRERYFPATLIEAEVVDADFGVDLASDDIRRAAIERAIDTGSARLTPPIELLSEARGLVMYVPVYAAGAPPRSVAERRATLEGVVLGVYRAGTLGSSIGRGLAEDQSVAILDDGALVTTIGPELATGRTVSSGVAVAGRNWVIRSGPTPRPDTWPPVAAAISGILVTVAIIALLMVLVRRERVATGEAVRRTREREEAVRSREKTEELYRALVATMADGVVVRAPDGRVLTSNAAAQRILGMTREEVEHGGIGGRPDRALIDQSGREIAESELPSARALAEGVAHGPEVVGITGKDGEPTWLAVSSEPMIDGSDPRPTAVVTCFSDITERVNAHERLRRERDHWAALIDAMQDGMIHADADGVITEVNRRFCTMTGFSEEQLVGTSAPYPFWPDDDEALNRLAGNLSAGWGGELDSVYRRADGGVLPVIIAASPMRDDRGRLSGVLLTIKDATEREKVDRAKDEFVSVVSHELRTPLTSIHGALGLLVEGHGDHLDDRGRNLLDIAARNTERLRHLINHVLDLEQITAGKDRAEFARARVADLLHQAADLLEPLAAENSVTFDVRPVDDDLTVFCDPNRIAQVLTNFLGNAIKFSPGGSTVTLDAARAGPEIEIRVRDRGRGIPADELERIFERFHQVDSSDRRLGGGAGLGLAISERIAELHGGRVWAESTVDVGSTFILSLPAATAVQLPVEESAEDPERTAQPQAMR